MIGDGVGADRADSFEPRAATAPEACRDREDGSPADELLRELLRLEATGLRRKAREKAAALVALVPTLDEKRAWTGRYLGGLPQNGAGRIRHELYEGIVFPALRHGFERGDAEACHLLGVTWNNFAVHPSFSEQIGWHSAYAFHRKAYALDPGNPRYGRSLLASLIGRLRYTFHEWPSGIVLDGRDMASGFWEVGEEIAMAASLDRGGDHSETLAGWAGHFEAYARRRRDDGST